MQVSPSFMWLVVGLLGLLLPLSELTLTIQMILLGAMQET